MNYKVHYETEQDAKQETCTTGTYESKCDKRFVENLSPNEVIAI